MRPVEGARGHKQRTPRRHERRRRDGCICWPDASSVARICGSVSGALFCALRLTMVCLSGTESLVICGSLQLQIVTAAAESSVNNGRTAATGQSSAGTATYLMHSSPHMALQVPWAGWEKVSRQDKHVAGLGGHYHRIICWSLGDAVCCSIVSQTSLAPVADVLPPRRSARTQGYGRLAK
ncbi:hypothetical protein CPLU01_00984 [Colletotrichum plurivorum]|uniref:Uncharacterized protein n=1 Tax=Colletotrichum plurivorum TaxID=2175906 RepID=A0A8H6U4F4_9PEZI|nr:hypothetical protein CPLU01_00984 [Colletotrichum plurivorum]